MASTSFLDFIPRDAVLAMRDFLWLRERIQSVHDEALTPQAIAVQEAEENGGITLEGKLIDGSEFTVHALDFRRLEFGNKPTGTADATVSFDVTAQPIFHKNFDLAAASFQEYQEKDIHCISVVTVQNRPIVSVPSLRIGGIKFLL